MLEDVIMNHLGEIDPYFTEEDKYDRFLRKRREQRAARIARDPEKYKDKRKRERCKTAKPVGTVLERRRATNAAYRARNRELIAAKQRAYMVRKREALRGTTTPI